jgi:hypothetical protein
MANLVLESGGGEKPGFWRSLGAAFISPPLVLNRLIFGDRYAPVLKSRDPAMLIRVQGGGSTNSSVRDSTRPDKPERTHAIAEYSMDYGIPGKPGYLYLRPFDFYHFEAGAQITEEHIFANVMTRGLLIGSKYDAGENARGIWGLYGSFDYLSPQVYRLSTTAASLGTTAQWWLARNVSLLGTGMAGIGYGAAGTIRPNNDERDFHYGAAPQSLLALRFVFGKRAMWDTTGNVYYISGAGASKAHGTERIGRLSSTFLVRLFGPHAVGVNYLISHRNARYDSASLADRRQTVETFSVVYNFLTDFRFGAVSWNDRGRDE